MEKAILFVHLCFLMAPAPSAVAADWVLHPCNQVAALGLMG